MAEKDRYEKFYERFPQAKDILKRYKFGLPQVQLSLAIGYSILSINKWRTAYSDFPGIEKNKKYDFAKVAGWLLRHPEVGQAGHRVQGKREQLMCDNLEKRNKLLDAQIDEADKRAVSVDRVLAAIAEERSILVTAFRKRVLSEIPAEIEGKSARDAHSVLEQAFNEFLSDVQKSIPQIIKAASK